MTVTPVFYGNEIEAGFSSLMKRWHGAHVRPPSAMNVLLHAAGETVTDDQGAYWCDFDASAWAQELARSRTQIITARDILIERGLVRFEPRDGLAFVGRLVWLAEREPTKVSQTRETPPEPPSFARAVIDVVEPTPRLTGSAWAFLRVAVFERDHYTCQYCGVRVARPHCDHVVPLARGGSNLIDNLVTACPDCNQAKHDKTPEAWAEWMTRMRRPHA